MTDTCMKIFNRRTTSPNVLTSYGAFSLQQNQGIVTVLSSLYRITRGIIIISLREPCLDFRESETYISF